MITGFNTDIPFEGVTYHVQTEDKGLDSPLILSLVYVGGAIIAAKRTPYEDLLAAGFNEKELTERLQRQHKLICAAIKAGRVEELKRMSAGANGDAAATEDAPSPEVGKGTRRKKASARQRAEAEAEASNKDAAAGSVEDSAAEGKKVAESKKAADGAGQSAEPEVSAKPSDARPEGFIEERPKPGMGNAAHLDLGFDILTNLVDEISALGEAQEHATHAREIPTPAQETAPPAVEEPQVEIVPVSNVLVEPDAPLKVEPLPLSPWGVQATVEADAQEELYLSLLDDEGDFRAGQLATIKVHVGRGAYGRVPVCGAAVTVKVLGTTFRPLILTTDTDDRGLAIIRALLPRFNSGRAALIIRATVGEEFSELRRIIHQ